MDKKYAYCLVCYSDITNSDFKLKCKCDICEKCFYNWIVSQNLDSIFNSNFDCTCPNHSCKKEIPLDWVFQNINSQNASVINSILFKKYFNTNKDLVKCPQNLCPFAGYLEVNHKCRKEFKCEVCNVTWVDDSRFDYTFMDHVRKYYYNFTNVISENASETVVMMTSKPCINCQIYVYKISGCDHITCTNCKKEWCYNCLGDYHTHVWTPNSICENKHLIKAVFTMLFSALAILKIICFSYYVQFMLYYLGFYGIIFGIAMGYYLSIGWLISLCARTFFKVRNYKFGTLQVLFLYSILLLHLKYFYDNYYVYELTIYLFLISELAILIFICFLVSLMICEGSKWLLEYSRYNKYKDVVGNTLAFLISFAIGYYYCTYRLKLSIRDLKLDDITGFSIIIRYNLFLAQNLSIFLVVMIYYGSFLAYFLYFLFLIEDFIYHLMSTQNLLVLMNIPIIPHAISFIYIDLVREWTFILFDSIILFGTLILYMSVFTKIVKNMNNLIRLICLIVLVILEFQFGYVVPSLINICKVYYFGSVESVESVEL